MQRPCTDGTETSHRLNRLFPGVARVEKLQLFFDALAELDQPFPYRSGGGGGSEMRHRARSRDSSGGGAAAAKSLCRDDIEVGRPSSASSPEGGGGGGASVVWRRSWGGTAADLADLSVPSLGGGGRGPGQEGLPGARQEGREPGLADGAGRGGREARAAAAAVAAAAAAGGNGPRGRLLSAAMGWCCSPVLKRLQRRSVEQVSDENTWCAIQLGWLAVE